MEHAPFFELLHVEDNPADVHLVGLAFKDLKSKINVTVVSNGDEAFDFLNRVGKFAEAPVPNLVLLDIGIPGLEGPEVLRRIKTDEKLKVIPVVILSSSQSETDIRQCYLQHANGYISKPDDADGVFEMVRAIEHYWFRTNLSFPISVLVR